MKGVYIQDISYIAFIIELKKAHELDIPLQESQSRDIEQEACLRVVSERLDRMGNEVEQLKKDVRQDTKHTKCVKYS